MWSFSPLLPNLEAWCYRLIEKRASCANVAESGKDLDRVHMYELLQIFVKISQLLEEDTGIIRSHLASFEARSQIWRHNVEELYQQAQAFMETQSFVYPMSAAGAYTLEARFY